MLYVDVSVRNDWASMLAFTPKQNIFYPSVGLSAVISSMTDLSKEMCIRDRWCGVQPGVCSMGETCGDALVVEHNGDVYSCDHFVYPEYKLGNIAQTPLDEIYRTAKRREFGLNKRNTLPSECLRCKFYFACRGECPKHRFDRGADGSPKNSLCEGLKIYFRHVEPYMEYMRDVYKRPP